MDCKNFTIEEIAEAWLEFNKPYWIIDNTKRIDISDLEQGRIISGAEMHQIPINYGDWIPFLIHWKKHQVR